MATKPLPLQNTNTPNPTNANEGKQGTSIFFFPKVVHLRRQDQSLLKFAPGPREVPNDLHPAELEILARSGAKPIGQVSKQVVTASEELAAAHATGADTAKPNAALESALAASGENGPELTKEEKDAKDAKAEADEAAKKAKK
jgi:hypothetical protein